MSSINQNAYNSALPNFRNLGILLRILLIVNVLAIGAAVVRATTLAGAVRELAEISALVQPLLIVTLLALVVLNDLLRRLPYFIGAAAVIALALGIMALFVRMSPVSFLEAAGPLDRYAVLVLLVTAILLAYFNLRSRALSPALAEARL